MIISVLVEIQSLHFAKYDPFSELMMLMIQCRVCAKYICQSINPTVDEYRNEFDRLGYVICILEALPQNARLEYGNIKWVNWNEKQGWEKCICFHFVLISGQFWTNVQKNRNCFMQFATWRDLGCPHRKFLRGNFL